MELMSVELGKGHKYSFICYKPETVSSHPINAIFYMYTRVKYIPDQLFDV